MAWHDSFSHVMAAVGAAEPAIGCNLALSHTPYAPDLEIRWIFISPSE
jgi:hypothetical protein